MKYVNCLFITLHSDFYLSWITSLYCNEHYRHLVSQPWRYILVTWSDLEISQIPFIPRYINLLSDGLFFFFFGLCPKVGWILVPWLVIKPVPPSVEAWSPNHWTTREFPPQMDSLLQMAKLYHFLHIFIDLPFKDLNLALNRWYL